MSIAMPIGVSIAVLIGMPITIVAIVSMSYIMIISPNTIASMRWIAKARAKGEHVQAIMHVTARVGLRGRLDPHAG